ncbi:CotH kinase family protein [candidate division KSB1 bacterium]|nr:CotH kinase family protein [candidate division KSB1 bacterium]
MNIIRISFIFSWLLVLAISGFSQSAVINEIMASNASLVQDDDGDYSDWIELYNPADHALDLQNYGLSDEAQNPFRWTFPRITLGAKAFLILFASDKNRTDVIIHLETIIDWGDPWRYFVGTRAAPANWHALGFDDTQWRVGASGFGYGDYDDSTNVTPADPFQAPPISVCIRKKFDLENSDQVLGLLLHVDYDDGFVAWLNGVEIARANMGLPGVFPAFDEFAREAHEAQLYQGGKPDKFRIENPHTLLRNGENVLALEVHNNQLFSSDLTLIPFLTLEMSTVPPAARGLSKFLDLKIPRLHANFKLSASGETLWLSNPAGQTVDLVKFGALPVDISFGRQPDGSGDWYYFAEVTPGSGNTRAGFQAIASEPRFNQRGGFYDAPLNVILTTDDPTAEIRFTLNSAAPTDTTPLYTAPIWIDSTTVVRAQCFRPGGLPSRIVTRTYFLQPRFELPVISLVSDPCNLFDHETGIYALGDHASADYPYFGANFWEDWERPVHVEFFEPNGQPGFALDAGVQIFGSWSRLYPQKSLALFARGQYGFSQIDYQVFPDKPIQEFQALVLRNSGQDWGRTLFRDALMQYLVRDTDLDIQAYRPAMVFINGQIWGIHNLREKMNEHYLASNRGVDPENIDLIERDQYVLHGDAQHYQALLELVRTQDMQLPANYENVQSRMEVENFIDYIAAELFFANSDWPWNNVKCWRPRTTGGKWKWLIFDLDYGFHGGHLGPDANVFDEMHAQDNGVTQLFFGLLKNETFRRAFINRACDHLNVTFDTSRVLRLIRDFQAGIEATMPAHIARWHHSFEGPWWLGKSIDSMPEWYQHIDVAVDFARHRSEFVRQHLMHEFQLEDSGAAVVNLKIQPPQSGKLQLNRLLLTHFPWQGIYFLEIPIQLTALPAAGYKFVRWEGGNFQNSPTIAIKFTADQTITAVFEVDATARPAVVINEINYKSAANFNTGDWVEIYNATAASQDLTGWIFKDGDDTHQFLIPANTILPANSYLVLCRDLTKFKKLWPQVEQACGNFDFGLSSTGETVRLFDARGNLIDVVTFGVTAPWPPEPNGSGATLALKDPAADNSLAQNWIAAANYGTPGSRNEMSTAISSSLTESVPITWTLEQNFPNPFNAETAISFALPVASEVELLVFDITGRECVRVLHQHLPAGVHSVAFQAVSFPSGLYFYQLIAGNQRWIRKMVVLK